MKKMLTLGMAVAMLAAACTAYAYPTLAGPTGLVSLPDAEVVKACTFDVAIDYYNTSDNGITDENSYPIRALYGFNGNFEVGLAYSPSAFAGEDFWNINAKFKTPYNYGGFDIALGALYGQADTEPDNTTATQIYLAATKAFNTGETGAIAGTIGVNWTSFDGNFVDTDGFRFYLGANAVVAENLAIVAEYQSEIDDLDDSSVWGAAVRYGFTPALAAQVGITNGPIVGADDANFFVGIDYGFGTVDEE